MYDLRASPEVGVLSLLEQRTIFTGLQVRFTADPEEPQAEEP